MTRLNGKTAVITVDRELDAVLVLQTAAGAFPVYRIEDDVEIRRVRAGLSSFTADIAFGQPTYGHRSAGEPGRAATQLGSVRLRAR